MPKNEVVPEPMSGNVFLATQVLIVLLTFTVVFAAGLLFQSFLWDYAVNETARDRLEAMDRDAFLIDSRLRGRANDVFFLKSVAEAELARDPKAPLASENLRNAARTMMLARSQYDQVRLLDLSGNEVFRFNWKGGQHPIEEVPPTALQNKSDRPYFNETLAASPNAAVFSPLDLNVEHHTIENPLKPILRVSGQIVGPDGKPRALLVLNYLGDLLLRELRQDKTLPRQSMLLNRDSFWLAGPNPSAEWAFMDPQRATENMKTQDPALWTKITSTKSGWFEQNGCLYCYENLDPVGSLTDYPPLRMPVAGGDRLRWTLLVKVPDASIWHGVANIRKWIWLGCAGALGALVPLICIIRAIGRRRRLAVREVLEARTLLDSVIDTSPHGITVMEAVRDPGGRITDLRLLLSNKAASQLLGEDLVRASREGRTMLEDHPGTHENGTFVRFCKVIETGESAMFEELYKGPGQERWLYIRAAKREDGVVVSMADISKRKAAEEKLRQSEMLLQMTGRMSKVGGWTVEYPACKVRWSEEVYRIYEVPINHEPTLAEGLGYYASEWRQLVTDAFETCVRDGTPFDLEVELITARSNRIWVRVMGKSEKIDGQLRRVHGTFQDITAAKQVSLELHESQKRLLDAVAHEQELARQAQAAERAKSEFLAVMSHEIRTPLNGVIGMTSLLSETGLTVAQRDFVDTIHLSGEALLAVINDILDFSKMESGKMNLDKKPFNLRQCVEEAVDLFAPQIREKRIEAAYLIAPEVPARMVGDSVRLRQILINLLSNAVKFTEHGEIVLNVRCQNWNEREYNLLFSVTDTGVGITPDGSQKLFQSFQQVDTTTTRHYGGTGLGLAISKRLTELMGGTMWVESKPGSGSTFFFTAILEATTDNGASAPPKRGTLKATSALIVDDNATSRNILETQLRSWGLKAVSVSSGKEALARLSDSRFDVALIDLQMPDMNGIALAGAIRTTTQMPIILLFSEGAAEVGEAKGLFQFQIPKPVKQSALFDALQEVSGGETLPRKEPPPKASDETMAESEPLRILLAEDNRVSQKVGLMMLSRLGYRADLAANGLEAVDMVFKNPYDLVFMDIQMPEMDGLEATRQLKEKLGPKCPLIVALTANAMEGDRERFLASGFDDYLSKPLAPDKLKNMLQSVLLKKQA